MKRNQTLILALILILTFFLIYTPHLSNPYPIHVDEWHHITEAIKLKQGKTPFGFSGLELGFHMILLIISIPTNLVLIYQFLPAIWTAFTTLILFYITRQKTTQFKNNFFIAIFTIIFFASIRSNVNITGLWFFTPLTFSIPFIFLYFHLLTKGIEKQNKKLIIYSLIIMLFLLPIHAISVLFAIPIITIYLLINYKYLIKEYKFFSLFLLIPIIGLLFYKFIMKIPFKILFNHLINSIQFKQGWGVLELNNSPFELYSLTAYILAIIGILFIFTYKSTLKKYLIYLLWPLIVLISIFIFKQTGISYLSPYQRNLYYLTISLPFLSALGLFYILELIKIQINKINIKNKKIVYKIIQIILIIIIISLTFNFYFNLQNQVKLYRAIDTNDYQALEFLSQFPPAKIMAPAMTSTAIFPISGHNPVGTIVFYGNRKDVEAFFQTTDCNIKNQILEKNKVKYIYSKQPIECNWELIYTKTNIFIYQR